MADLKTDNAEVLRVVRDLTAAIAEVFGGRVNGVYAMGSLARGGFSEAASDIDIGVILSHMESADANAFDQLTTAAQQKISNRISIFWGDAAALRGATDAGRYPPFDRLDLLDHGLLLLGEDTRDEAMRPGFEELLAASADFALEYLATPERIEDFLSCQRIAAQGRVSITKTILFPARFIYLAATGQVAGNDVATDYYEAHFNGPDVELVNLGFAWRSIPLPETSEISSALQNGLIPLYVRFLNAYQPLLNKAGHEELARRLAAWQRALMVDAPEG